MNMTTKMIIGVYFTTICKWLRTNWRSCWVKWVSGLFFFFLLHSSIFWHVHWSVLHCRLCRWWRRVWSGGKLHMSIGYLCYIIHNNKQSICPIHVCIDWHLCLVTNLTFSFIYRTQSKSNSWNKMFYHLWYIYHNTLDQKNIQNHLRVGNQGWVYILKVWFEWL